MPDYNLGRAHGEIIITADTSGAERAAAAMTAADAAAAAHGRTLDENTNRIGRNESAMRRASATAQGYKQRITEMNDAESRLRKTLLDSSSTAEDIARARRNHAAATRNAQEAERALADEMRRTSGVLTNMVRSFTNFGKSIDDNGRHVRNFSNELKTVEKTANSLASVLSGTLLTAFKAIGAVGGIGALGGLLGLLGGGAMNAVVAATVGAAQGIMNLSGALIALPAIITGVVFAFGTLKTAFSGVGQALKDAEDPKKFAEDLRKLAPAAQEVVKILASYRDAFRGAKMQVQQSLFGPMVNDIQGLIRTWLPALMQGAKMVANMFGQMGHEVATWLKQPESMKAFKQFIDNITAGMKAMMPAIRPILSAFATLNVVGSSVFPRIGAAITSAANSFNKWIQATAASGQLKAWLDQALTSMHNAWLMAKNLGGAIFNIISIASQFHGGFLLDFLERFNNWTKSVKGQNQLTNFFATLKESGDALKPVLTVVGTILGQLALNLVKLGTALGPGFTQFFKGFGDGLNTFGQSLIASAPALNQFLAAFGQFIAQIMQELGPALPAMLSNLAQALIALSPILVTVAGAIANFLSHLSPDDIETIMALVGALRLLPPVLAVINLLMSANPIGLVVIAIGALVAAVVFAYEHFDGFRTAVDNAWNAIKNFGSKLGELASEAKQWGSNLIDSFAAGIREKYESVKNAVTSVASILPDWLRPGSPTKSGPLSVESTQSMGQRLASGFATGISDAAPLVQASTHSIAGMAASGFALSSADVAGSFLSGVGAKYGGSSGGSGGSSGGGVGGGTSGASSSGKSGLSQKISFIVQDMQAWIQIASQAKDLFDKVKDTIIGGIATLANVWNGGDNPLTGPNGIATMLGVGPGANGQKKVNAVPQQSIPGITNIGPNGENNPPAQVQGQQPANGTLAGNLPTGVLQNANGQWQTEATPEQIQQAIIAGGRARGLTDDQIVGALSTADNESANGRNIYGGEQGIGGAWGVYQQGDSYGTVADRQDPNKAINAFLDRYAAQLASNPDADIFKVATGVQQHGGPWQGTEGDQWFRGQISRQELVDRARKALETKPAQVQGDAFENNPLLPGGMGAFGPAKDFGTPHVGNLPSLTDILAEAGGAVRSGMPGAAPALGPWGIPAGQISGITPITDPSMVGLGQYWGGILPSTYGGHQVQGGVNRGIDWGAFKGWTNRPGQAYGGDVGAQIGTEPGGSRQLTREEADRMTDFAKWLTTQAGVEQVIWMNPYTGEKVGKDPGDRGANQSIENYYRDDWAGHSQHVHSRMTQRLGLPGEPGLTSFGAPLSPAPQNPPASVAGDPLHDQSKVPMQGAIWDDKAGQWLDPFNKQPVKFDSNGVAVPQGGPPVHKTPQQLADEGATLPGGYPATVPPSENDPGAWMRLPEGADPNKPIPMDVRRQHGIPDEFPDMYYSARPGPQYNVPAVQGSAAPTLAEPGVPGITPPDNFKTGSFTASSVGVAGLNVAQGLSSFGAVFGDVFTLMNDFVKSISATSEISEQLVRGVSDTQDVNKLIDNFQTYITFASDIAKTVGDSASAVGSIVGAGASADPTGGAGAAAGAIQAVAGVASFISGALQATNMAIDLGQAIVKQTMKYGAIFEGYLLGNAETGALGGNVRMLLNTNTGDIMAYSQDSPKNKNVINLPSWFDRAYGGTRQGPVDQRTQLNIYAGPGQSPRDMMNESMWLIGTAGPSVVSVAGRE